MSFLRKTISLFGGVMFYSFSLFAQRNEMPLYIGSNFPAITVNNVINYTTDTVNISMFKDKLVILDFWNVHCTVCISMFAEEIDLQEQFKNELQFILVTRDPEDKVRKTIQNWEQQTNRKFTLPIVVGDTLLRKYMRSYYQPNFAWISYRKQLIAHTSKYFINATNIQGMLAALQEQKRRSDEGAKTAGKNTIMNE